MKTRSKEEIEQKVVELWSDRSYGHTKNDNKNGWGREDYYPKVDVEPDKVQIEISDMYDRPGFTFAQLMALAEFFETDNIVDVDHTGYGGCETCDYGSYYSFTLEIKPGKWPLK